MFFFFSDQLRRYFWWNISSLTYFYMFCFSDQILHRWYFTCLSTSGSSQTTFVSLSTFAPWVTCQCSSWRTMSLATTSTADLSTGELTSAWGKCPRCWREKWSVNFFCFYAVSHFHTFRQHYQLYGNPRQIKKHSKLKKCGFFAICLSENGILETENSKIVSSFSRE